MRQYGTIEVIRGQIRRSRGRFRGGNGQFWGARFLHHPEFDSRMAPYISPNIKNIFLSLLKGQELFAPFGASALPEPASQPTNEEALLANNE